MDPLAVPPDEVIQNLRAGRPVQALLIDDSLPVTDELRAAITAAAPEATAASSAGGRHRHSGVPIIFVTSCATSTCRLPDGTECDVITKPYLMAELAVKALMHLTAARS